VNESRAAAIDAMRPGKLGLEVDQLSRDVLAKYGLDGYFGHGLGHSLGLQVHDSPSGMRDIEIAEGMVLTVEPGVYIEGFGGCRIEDDVVLRASGAECLTKSPRELLIL
jgi:Xaa-Pro aminopeptidase